MIQIKHRNYIEPSANSVLLLLLLRIFVTEQLSGVCRYPAGSLSSVRSGAEIGLLNLRLSISQGASLGDFLLAPACPIEKVSLWEGFLYLTSGSETDEGVAEDEFYARTGNRTRDSWSKPQYAIHQAVASPLQILCKA